MLVKCNIAGFLWRKGGGVGVVYKRKKYWCVIMLMCVIMLICYYWTTQSDETLSKVWFRRQAHWLAKELEKLQKGDPERKHLRLMTQLS